MCNLGARQRQRHRRRLDIEQANDHGALAFLHRIGLVPIVVHGAGLFTGRRPQPVKEVAVAAEDATNADVSHGDLVRTAAEHMTQVNARLVAALLREGVEAQPFVGSVFEAARDDAYEGALAGAGVGRITSVDVDAITSAISSRVGFGPATRTGSSAFTGSAVAFCAR